MSRHHRIPETGWWAVLMWARRWSRVREGDTVRVGPRQVWRIAERGLAGVTSDGRPFLTGWSFKGAEAGHD